LGTDFTEVLITVKADSISSIPSNLTVKNYDSTGAISNISNISIIAFEDLTSGSDSSSDGPGFEPIPEAYSSSNEQYVELQGGGCFGDVLQAIGALPPLVPHAEPSSAAPAASIVSRALACALPLPLVAGGPILSKPKKVVIKQWLGFFDVFVLGSEGERSAFRLPLRRTAPDLGCKGILVANFTTATVGLIDSIALVGPQNLPCLAVDVLARGAAPNEKF
jgi:hypothetical protein